jgi:putative addiction module killer protein
MPNSTEREISYYQDIKGNMPLMEWLKSFKDKKTVAIIAKRIDRMEEGLLGDCKHVGAGVYELRIDYGAGHRVYFGQVGTELVLLLCGGDKSTQKKDIKKAILYWLDYKERTKNNE